MIPMAEHETHVSSVEVVVKVLVHLVEQLFNKCDLLQHTGFHEVVFEVVHVPETYKKLIGLCCFSISSETGFFLF